MSAPFSGGSSTATTSSNVTATDIAEIVKDHPRTTFKVKIDACYSGRFIERLPKDKNPNLLILETSSSATETSMFHNKAYRHPDGTTRINLTNNPGNIRAADGRSEFTNGNLSGMEKFVASQAEVAQAQQAGGSLLARMMERAFVLGRDDDFAATIGLTHPQIQTNFPPPVVPACDQAVAAGLTTYLGSPHMQVTGLCPSLLTGGLHHVRVDTPPGRQINAFAAHSTSCTPTPPTPFLNCVVKPDGRICTILSFDTPPAAGDVVGIRLEREDGFPIQGLSPSLAAGEQPACQTGS